MIIFKEANTIKENSGLLDSGASFFSAPLLTEFDKISLVIPVVIAFICVFSIPLLIVSAILSFTTSDRLKNLESESNLYIFLARRGFTDRESDEIIAELENV